jgi:hypothetical protein
MLSRFLDPARISFLCSPVVAKIGCDSENSGYTALGYDLLFTFYTLFCIFVESTLPV